MKVIFFSLVLLITACKSDNLVVYNVSSYEKPEIKKIKIEGLDNLFATGICLHNNLAVVKTNDDENFFHVIDWKEKKLIWSFGKTEGPNAFIRPECFCQFIEENDSIKLVILDKVSRLSLVNIYPEVDTSSVIKGAVKYKVPEVYTTREVFLAENESKVVGNGGVDGIMYSYDNTNKVVTWNTQRPSIKRKYEKDVLDLIYESDAAISEENKCIVIAYRLFNRIDIFDFSGNLIKTIHYEGEKKIEPIIEDQQPSIDMIVYFGNHITTSKDMIFLLAPNESLRTRFEREDNGDKLFSLMHIIDFEGNLIKALRIEDKIRKFDIDTNSHSLIALIDTDDNVGSSNIIEISL